MTRVRRHLPRALWCAGMGLCATVAVSWACALWSHEPVPAPMRFGQSHIDQPVTHLHDLERFGLVYRIAMTEYPSLEEALLEDDNGEAVRPLLVREKSPLWLVSPGGASSSFIVQYTIDKTNDPVNVFLAYIEMRAGWPMSALRARSVHRGADRTITGVDTPARLAGIAPPRMLLGDGSAARTLPVSPIWPGLLVNTAIYASLIWLTVFGLGVVRRMHRTQRGRCAECGYELAGQETCPRCRTSSAVVVHPERTPEVAR
jgi:hypothetical protein